MTGRKKAKNSKNAALLRALLRSRSCQANGNGTGKQCKPLGPIGSSGKAGESEGPVHSILCQAEACWPAVTYGGSEGAAHVGGGSEGAVVLVATDTGQPVPHLQRSRT